MRKRLIIANWKMHGLKEQVKALAQAIQQGIKNLEIDCVLLPTFVHLNIVKEALGSTPIALGAQNLYLGQQGAFTGEVAGPMLKDIGCKYVLVGHSERRSVFGENLNLVAAKFHAAQAADLIPILCIGETEAERKENKTETIIHTQLASIFLQGEEAVSSSITTPFVIAYEPVWAIGTGLTPSPQQAQSVHAFIRNFFAGINIDIANTMRILYGGSMNIDNAQALLNMPDIDGGLIGGASLNAESFLKICKV